MNRTASRWRRALGAAVAGVSLLAVSAATAGEITVWAWSPEFNGASMQAAAEAYAKNNPGATVNIVDFDKAALEQKLQTQLAAGITDDLPDIVLIEDYGAQKYLQSFPGAFEPLNGAFDYSQFAPYKVELATVGDQTYSLPFDSGLTVLYYRTDLLEQAGFTAADLDGITWDRYLEIGQQVEAATGHKMTSHDVTDPGLLRMMLQSAGTWYFTPEGEPNLVGNPVFKASLATLQKFLMSDVYKPTSGWNDYTGAFIGGEVASVNSAVWMVAGIKGNAELSGKWGAAPLPRLADVEASTNYSNWGGSSWYVLASSKNKEEAVDFLAKVWAGDVEFYQQILVGQGAVGSWLPARTGSAYSSSDAFFSGQPVWQNFSDWLAKIPGVNYGLFTNEADEAVRAQLPALAAGGDLDEIIAAIDAQVRQQTM
jgi:lactose/L-arabinose transport system substrate-binding protein